MLPRCAGVFALVLALVACGSPGAPTPDERASAVLAACGLGANPASVALTRAGLTFRLNLSEISLDEVECLELATRCEEVTACTGTAVADVASCEPARCEGDVAVNCTGFVAGGGVEVRDDCARDGLRCVPPGTGAVVASCGVGPCTTSGRSCVSETEMEDCTVGVLTRTTCPSGTTCVDELGCVGPPCTASRCEGTVSHFCDPATLRERVFDCGIYGQGCDDGSCVSADECTLSLSTCVGDEVVYCAASGRDERYDCRAAGLGGCVDGHCTVSE